jgi:hypothetical protein
MRNAHNILVRNLKERYHLEDIGINKQKTLKWIVNKYDAMLWTGFILFMIGTSGGITST